MKSESLPESKKHEPATAEWFAEFESHTNQKECTQNVLVSFLSKFLKDKETVRVLDIGCARGLLSVNIIKGIGKERVSYSGIDSEASAIEEAQRLFKRENIQATCIQGNCFVEEGQQQLPDNADVVLLSHVAYYTPNLKEFAKTYVKKLGTDGIAIFIHDAPDSDINQLRTKYQASVSLNTANGIEDALKDNGVHAYSYQTLLQFPNTMHHLWDILKRVSYDRKTETHIPHFQEAKHLLEFVVQQPLESLQEKGLLGEYLDDVKGKLETQENCLHIRSRMHIVLSQDRSHECPQKLSQALETLEKTIENLQDAKVAQAQKI